jgi:hypothetical protein
MRWSWLKNRFVITFGGVALLAVVWNVYIAYHDDGVIEGRVVAADGTAVEGATVTLSERTLLVAQAVGRTKTDAEGRFHFEGHQLHRLYLEAAKQDVGRFGPREYRLYFKSENLLLDEPLKLAAPGSS